jgi:hypothetical protein
MNRIAKSPQDDSESDNKRSFAARNSRTNRQVGLNNHRAFGKPVLNNQTPFRPKAATASSASSSGSSSTASTPIFDSDLRPVGTPITPPIYDIPEPNNANNTRLASHGKMPTELFMEKCVDTKNRSSAPHTPATTSAAKRSPRNSSASESLVGCMKNLSVRDHEERFRDEVGPRPDNSPSLMRRSNGKNRGLQAVQGKDDYLQFSTENGESKRKSKIGDSSRTNELVSTESNNKAANPLNHTRDISRSSKRKGSKTPSPVNTHISSEVEEVDADSSGMTAQNLPLSGQYQGRKGTLSTPRVSHKRSESAPGPHNTSNIIAQDSPAAATSSRNTSPPQSNGVHPPLLNPARATKSRSKQRTSTGTALPAPTRHNRSRSTFSLKLEQSVVSSIEPRSPADVERMPGAFPIEPFNILGASRQSPSCKPAETTPDLEPDETRKFQKLEDKHPIKKNKNDLNKKILHVIRRQNVKPAAKSNLNHGYVYIFKSTRYSGCVKIGSTVKEPDDRIKQWGSACKFIPIHVTDENDKAFRFCRIVEQIVHAELYNEQKKFYCDECKSKHYFSMTKREAGTGKKELELRPSEHGEWFEVSEEKAKEVVNKWRDWVIHQEPYNQDATLRSCWLWKHDMATKRLKGTDAEWDAWRQFDWLDIIHFVWYGFNKWLGEVSPPLQILLNSSGSVFVLATGFHLWAFGVNLASCLRVGTVLLLYRFICFKFC